ncbi:SIS domain-containing protein [Jeongeupia wiesaeckerbachi]|uniref:sugar isomerase domain-containing protein n=1 Tax=Jeongeupia wiesaeckerbachi TaxID=3051218 RepID=UPI003D806AC9
MYDFLAQSLPRLQRLIESQHAAIDLAAEKMVAAIGADRLIFAFGTGHSHMVPMELFGRAGGLANVAAMLDDCVLNGGGATRSSRMERLPGLADILWDEYGIAKGDLLLIVSNSGLNASVVEMAQRARAEGVYCVALTSLEQSRANTSRHPSGAKLYELADLVIDNGAPDGDALLRYGELGTGSFSSLSGIAIAQILVAETVRRCVACGIDVPLYQSQNTDRVTGNAALFARYKPRIKHL